MYNEEISKRRGFYADSFCQRKRFMADMEKICYAHSPRGWIFVVMGI